MLQRARAEVAGAEGERAVDEARDAGCRLGFQDDVAAVVEPDFQQQHSHEVPEVDEAEHGHGGGAVGREVHLEGTFGMSEVQLQGQRRDEQERERGEQGEAVGGFDGFDAEDAFERGQDEGAGDESRDEGIENDEDAPLELDFVRIHEAFDGDLQAVSFPCVLLAYLPRTNASGAKCLPH